MDFSTLFRDFYRCSVDEKQTANAHARFGYAKAYVANREILVSSHATLLVSYVRRVLFLTRMAYVVCCLLSVLCAAKEQKVFGKVYKTLDGLESKLDLIEVSRLQDEKTITMLSGL